MKKILVIVIPVALIIAGVFAYKRVYRKPETQVLETAKVEKGDVKGVLVETGIIKPQVGAVVKIGTRATGTIVRMNVKVGDRVKTGDLVALIDDREIVRNIEQERAALISAQNTLAQVEKTYPERIREAEANYEYARITFSREQELLKEEYTTREALDKARNQFIAARAIRNRLQDEFKTQVDILKANIEQITARIRQQEVKLSYTRIHAPIDGVVSEVTAQEGETIVAGLQVANLVTVLDPLRLEMWTYIDETDIGRVEPGRKIEYFVDTYPERVFEGVLDTIYPQPTTKDNIVYYLATTKVPEKDALLLRPEMTTHVRIVYDEKRDVLAAPNAAVKYEKGQQVAYRVVEPGRVEKVPIEIGLRGEDRTEILSGVRAGDELATKLILPAPENP